MALQAWVRIKSHGGATICILMTKDVA